MSTERRTKARYPLELTVHYQTLSSQPVCGTGRTLNVSSSGALIAAEHDLDEGARLKITIEWPTLLNGTTPLQLVMTGKVVRHGGAKIGVAFDWYQFRTMKRGSSIALSTALSKATARSGPLALSNRGAAKTAAAGIPLRNAG